MGEVKRYWPDGNGDAAYMIEHGSTSIADDEPDGYVRHSDYARLERERDECDAAASGLCGEVAELTMKLEKADAELTRLRAVEAAAQEYKQSMADAIEEDRPEWTRLRDIEVAARDMLAKLDSEGYSGPYMRALAEACGRKG